MLIGAEQVAKMPNTAAGARTVAFPRWPLALIESHSGNYSEGAITGAVFVGSVRQGSGAADLLADLAARHTAADLPNLHFRDLRHIGNHLAAMSGASTLELMGRTGHVNVDAALVYQHRTASRDQVITADALDRMVSAWTIDQPGLPPRHTLRHVNDSGVLGGTTMK